MFATTGKPARGGADLAEPPTAPRIGRSGHATVRAVSRALAVLRAFTPARPRLSLAEAAQAAGLDKGTTRRLLLTLIDEGLVRQDPASQRYALTLRMIALAGAVETGGLREEARPVMARLAAATGATVFLSVPDRPGALCLERVHGHDPVRVQWWGVGSHMPWNCGAGPHVLLASMDAQEVAEALDHPRALTPHSATDVAHLREHFATIRARGFEVTVDDVVVGLAAVAVPVRDAADRTVAALSLGGLRGALLTADGAPRWLDALRAAASEISSHLR